MTNKHNMPAWYVRAVEKRNAKYSTGGADYSVTALIKPPFLAKLQREHWDEIEHDCIDEYYKFRGHMVHAVVEDSEGENTLAEQRISVEVNGKVVSGKADLYEDKTIYDIKSVLSATALYEIKPEQIQQLNMYAYLYRSLGFPVKNLMIGRMYVDWRDPGKSKDSRTQGNKYPATPAEDIPVEVWPSDVVREFIVQRINMHENPNPDICTPEERWAKGEVWAVKKPKRKSAVPGGLHDTKEAAEKHAAEFEGGYVEHRPAEDTRCMKWCEVKQWCPYAQEKGYV